MKTIILHVLEGYWVSVAACLHDLTLHDCITDLLIIGEDGYGKGSILQQMKVKIHISEK